MADNFEIMQNSIIFFHHVYLVSVWVCPKFEQNRSNREISSVRPVFYLEVGTRHCGKHFNSSLFRVHFLLWRVTTDLLETWLLASPRTEVLGENKILMVDVVFSVFWRSDMRKTTYLKLNFVVLVNLGE